MNKAPPQIIVRMIAKPKNTTRNETSRNPAGGITRRTGAITGSVMSSKTRLIDASGEPEWTGNHERIARAIKMTM